MSRITSLSALVALAQLFGTELLAADVAPVGEERILYASEQASGSLALLSMTPVGDDKRMQVRATVRGRGESEGAISPDGIKVAFTTYRYGGWKVGVSNLDGSEPVRVTLDPQYAYDPVWAPDGKSLLYRRIENKGRAYYRGNGDIYSINLDGSGNRNLSRSDNEHDRNPAYSPDGQFIIYDSFVGEILKIQIMDASGENRRFIPGAATHMFAPSWSPDGHWIAHMRADNHRNVDVWIMRPDGSEARNVTNGAARGYAPEGNSMMHWHHETSWSADGTRIAFVADYEEQNNADIYTVDIESKVITRLTQHRGLDLHPSWYRALR